MAAIFCLFSVTLCKLAGQDVEPAININNTISNTMSLSAPQIITVPRVYISPCPNSFRYTFNGKEWFGLLAIPSFKTRIIHVKVELTIGMNFVSNYVGDISLVKDKQSTIADVANGMPVLYRVRFPVQNPLPKLTAVYYNNQLICTGPSDVGEFITTIQLDHALYTGLSLPPVNQQQQQPVQPQPQPQQQQQRVPPPTQPIRPQAEPQPARPPFTQQNVITSNSGERAGEFSSQCGVPNYRAADSTGLVVNGKQAIKGQFPWLAAFHFNGISSSGFICGGSLVSSKVVITAAHCVQDKRDNTIRKPEESLFYLGKYYLHSQPNERDYIISAVSQFIIHPDWNAFAETFDADISAAILTRTIQFTNFIRPICVWTSSTNYNDILNQQGVVAGYGKTESSLSASDKPMWIQLPVVDEGTCLRSNTALSKITSRRTFCVGNRDGSGPCNGDSGGAFIVKNNGKWYLRGIVSSSLLDTNTYMCDTQNYAVFTDAAAFKDWILHKIETYG